MINNISNAPQKAISFNGNNTISTLENMGKTAKTSEKALSISCGEVKKLVPDKELTKFETLIAKGMKPLLSKFAKMAGSPKGIGYLMAGGNVLKESCGTAIYTIQALTNDDLPKDKRKFVGMYDFGVGAVSTGLQAIVGIAMVAMQTPWIETMLGGEKAKQHANWARGFAGLAYAIPLITQNILIKRMIAPAIATPFAGKMKARMEAKEAAKKEALTPQQDGKQEPASQEKIASIITSEKAEASNKYLLDLYKTFKANK